MSLDLSTLDNAPRLLFAIPLKPMQGSRFQPTGFPNLGAATFRTKEGESLLVESVQSMANHMELTVWDEAKQGLKPDFAGLSHVRVLRESQFLTDSILESHRLNSPYLLTSADRTFLDPFLDELRSKLGAGLIDSNEGLVDHKGFAQALLKFDIGSLLHGLFLSNDKVKRSVKDKKPSSIAGGRLRLARAVSAFIEADGVRVAASGGVKNDPVNPSGPAKSGFGNVPFARDEFTADRITLYANIDLAQIRGYGLDDAATRLLILLALYKLRALVDGDLRLRTACEFEVDPDASNALRATRPDGFVLPTTDELLPTTKDVISAVGKAMQVTEVSFDDKLIKGKDNEVESGEVDSDSESPDRE